MMALPRRIALDHETERIHAGPRLDFWRRHDQARAGPASPRPESACLTVMVTCTSVT
jgi:hypothetical protein